MLEQQAAQNASAIPPGRGAALAHAAVVASGDGGGFQGQAVPAHSVHPGSQQWSLPTLPGHSVQPGSQQWSVPTLPGHSVQPGSQQWSMPTTDMPAKQTLEAAHSFCQSQFTGTGAPDASQGQSNVD